MCDNKSFANHDLWLPGLCRADICRYAHYDNVESFSDFSPFGGWSHPSIKQYKGTTGICGTSIDYDFY